MQNYTPKNPGQTYRMVDYILESSNIEGELGVMWTIYVIEEALEYCILFCKGH